MAVKESFTEFHTTILGSRGSVGTQFQDAEAVLSIKFGDQEKVGRIIDELASYSGTKYSNTICASAAEGQPVTEANSTERRLFGLNCADQTVGVLKTVPTGDEDTRERKAISGGKASEITKPVTVVPSAISTESLNCLGKLGPEAVSFSGQIYVFSTVKTLGNVEALEKLHKIEGSVEALDKPSHPN